MAKSSSSGENKTPLIIALVFFVLATIGLGVFCYTQNDEIAAARGAAATAAKDKTTADNEAKARRDEVVVYKAALGILNDEDKGRLKGLQDPKAAEAAYRAMMDAVNQSAGKAINDFASQKLQGNANFAAAADVIQWEWPAGAAGVDPPVKSVIDSAVAAMGERTVAFRTTDAEREATKVVTQVFKTKSAEREDDAKKFKEATRAIPGEIAKKTGEIQAGYEAKAKEFVTVQGESRANLEARTEELNKANVAVRRRDDRIAIQERKIEELLDKQTDLVDPFAFDKPQGRVLRRYSGSLVDIDLGTSDKLRAGISFSIFPSDTIIRGMQPRMRPFTDQDGRTSYRPVPKGKIEVVSVEGANIARCRIIDEDNAVRDRIIPGDLLYNAVWRKGVSEHVALFGVFDLDGDGRDDMQTLIAGLRRVGVVVDAYYDLAKMKWEGEITSLTNFALEGYYPTVSAADGNRDDKIKILTAMGNARKEIKDKGISILRPRDFFPRIGYGARFDINQDAINQAATGFTRAQPPAAKPEEKKPEGEAEKKPEDKKN